jgi:hypothetical protein
VKGVRFVTDSEGHKVAAHLDLEGWGELWEDTYDDMLADERAGEPRVSLDEFDAGLKTLG